ncbi:MAG TPA: serine hydrolase [Terriglobia bacterium]|nr:serine hydrolase [Terriglobia bacterium]
MKQTILLSVLTLSLLSAACASTTTMPQGTAESPAISRIENGLLPAIITKGQDASMKLADRMAFHKVPGVSIAVIHDGRLEWAKGYGVLESGSPRAVTAETLFQAASISKPVAAMAALALVEQGKLSLDEDANLRLTSWRLPDNTLNKTEKVTLRRLLSHSAGLTVHGFPGYSASASVPTLQQILDGQKPANTPAIRVDILPGKQFRYSGGGYTVLQQLMIDVTGRPFPDLLQDLVLRKIGMSHSTFTQPLPKDQETNAAYAHEEGKAIKGRWHAYPEMAAAGLWTTPTDLALFAIDLMESAQGKPGKVLSPEMARQMLTRQIGAYGLGVNVGDSKGVASFSHGGGNEGFTCILVANVNTRQGAVVMTNGDNGPALFNEILRGISREYNWPDNRPQERSAVVIKSSILAAYAGRYDADGTPVTIDLQSGQLSIQAAPLGPSAIRLHPLAEDRFFVQESSDFHVRFAKDDKGNVLEIQIEAGPDRAIARRVK